MPDPEWTCLPVGSNGEIMSCTKTAPQTHHTKKTTISPYDPHQNYSDWWNDTYIFSGELPSTWAGDYVNEQDTDGVAFTEDLNSGDCPDPSL